MALDRTSEMGGEAMTTDFSTFPEFKSYKHRVEDDGTPCDKCRRPGVFICTYCWRTGKRYCEVHIEECLRRRVVEAMR